MISGFLDVFRFVLWPNMFSILENVPHVLECVVLRCAFFHSIVNILHVIIIMEGPISPKDVGINTVE